MPDYATTSMMMWGALAVRLQWVSVETKARRFPHSVLVCP